MTDWRTPLVATLTLVLAFVLAGRADAETSRPFRATVEGFANPVFTGPCSITNTEAGTGQALHAGRISWASEETVDLCASPDGGVVTGTMVVTAANGDQIFVSYETLAILDFTANQVTAYGTYEVTGGTGRFEDATGEGVISAVGSLSPPFDVTGGMVGRISY